MKMRSKVHISGPCSSPRLLLRSAVLSLFATLTLSPSSAATSFDCSKILAAGRRYDLSLLGGPLSLSLLYPNPPSVHNTTYTVNICHPLKRHSQVPAYDECPAGTRVCIMKRIRNEEDDKEVISKVITVAGDFVHDGRDMNSKFEQLRDVRRDDEGRGADEDAGKEGLRMILHGGIYPLSSKEGRKGRKQSAIVDFVCDTSRTGQEGLGSDEGDVEMQRLIRRAQTNGDVGITAEKNPSLQLISYGIDPADDERDLLRLRWLTKYACDRMASDPDGDTDPVAPSPDLPGSDASSGHGFFFWVFLVVIPVLISAYVIFTCYLNYSRNGASGLELLPHADTVQDLPYLLRDWLRRMISTFQGGGSRGGYSAV